jgi:molecular chaperone Hsp33
MQPDVVQRFLFENLDIRGTYVSLDHSLQTILKQHQYPEIIGQLLGETLCANVLLSSTIKYQGRLIMQLQNQGAVQLLVSKCRESFDISGLVRWDESHPLDSIEKTLNQGKLVVTILHKDKVEPQQSIIPIEQQGISHALEDYFSQSEQLPTKLWIKADSQRTVGLLLQLLPEQSAESTQNFYLETAKFAEQNISKHFFDLEAAPLLQQLFPGQDIRLFDSEPVQFGCDCSLARMKNAILTLGQDEAYDILSQKQVIDVTCDFCSKQYGFSREEVDTIFSESKG